MRPVSQVRQTQRVAINARCRAHAEHHVLEYPFHGTLITHSSLRCLLLSCLSSPVVPSWLVLLIGWLAHSPYAFGNQSSCAGPPGLRAPLDALREAWPQRPAIALWLHAHAHRNVAFHNVSYNTVHQTPRVGKVWAVVALSWGSHCFIGLAFSGFQQLRFVVCRFALAACKPHSPHIAFYYQ